MQFDARVEERVVRRCQAQLVVFEKDRARGLRPVQRVHVAQSAASFFEIRFEHERDFARLRVPLVDARREPFEPSLRAAFPLRKRGGAEIHRE